MRSYDIEDDYLHHYGGCIICIPAYYQSSNGNKYYLGVFPDDMDFIGKDDERQIRISNKLYLKYG